MGLVHLLAYLGMLLLLAAMLAVGWLLSGPGHDGRKAMALATSVRNTGVSPRLRVTGRVARSFGFA